MGDVETLCKPGDPFKITKNQEVDECLFVFELPGGSEPCVLILLWGLILRGTLLWVLSILVATRARCACVCFVYTVDGRHY